MLSVDGSGANKINLVQQLLKHEANQANVLGLWYDWFCSESSLFNRGKRLWSAAKSIVHSEKFKAEDCYVFFKNNCPASKHPTYDSFKICDKKSGDVLFSISRNAWGFAGWEVHCENHWDEPIVKGSWKEVKAWFMPKPVQLKMNLAMAPQLALVNVIAPKLLLK